MLNCTERKAADIDSSLTFCGVKRCQIMSVKIEKAGVIVIDLPLIVEENSFSAAYHNISCGGWELRTAPQSQSFTRAPRCPTCTSVTTGNSGYSACSPAGKL